MIVGVLGGIGAGKSTVVRMLVDLGAEAVDADQVAHQVLETSRVREALKQRLGSGVFQADGRVDRKEVARRVFSRPDELRELEGLIHPEVRRIIEESVEGFRKSRGKSDVLVLDVPLLAESPLKRHCDSILYIEAGPEVRRQRVENRGWTSGELERREKFQKSSEEKRSVADCVVDNSGTLEETRRQVTAYYEGVLRSSEG